MITKKLGQLILLIVMVCCCVNMAYGSTLTTVDVSNSAMNKDVSVSVIVPDAYSQNGDRRFAVLYLLHGAGEISLKCREACRSKSFRSALTKQSTPKIKLS